MQRLAAAGRHPAGQFGQVGFNKLLVKRFAGQFGGVPFAHKGVQIGKQLGPMVEIAIQENFRVERSQILKVAQGNRLDTAAVHHRQVRIYVFVVSLQVFSLNLNLAAAADQVVIEETSARSVEALIRTFGIIQHVFIAFVAQKTIQPGKQDKPVFQPDIPGPAVSVACVLQTAVLCETRPTPPPGQTFSLKSFSSAWPRLCMNRR